jgi:hypothetical protein
MGATPEPRDCDSAVAELSAFGGSGAVCPPPASRCARRSLAPLVKTRGFGMTPRNEEGFVFNKLHQCCIRDSIDGGALPGLYCWASEQNEAATGFKILVAVTINLRLASKSFRFRCTTFGPRPKWPEDVKWNSLAGLS